MTGPQAADGEGLERRMKAVNMLNSCRQPIRGDTPTRVLGGGLITPHHKKPACYKMLHAYLFN